MCRKRLKSVLLLFLSLILAVSFMACSSGDKAAAGNAGSSDSVIKGTVTFASDVYNAQDWDKISSGFAAKYPGIKIEYEQLPVEGPPKEDKLKTWFATGSAPDVIEFPECDFWLSTYQNQLVVLDDYIAKDKEFKLDNLAPGTVDLIKQYVKDGKIHGLPGQFNPGGMIFNKTLFDKFKIPYPTNDMTWEQVFELAKKITRDEDGQKYYGLWFSNFDSYHNYRNLNMAAGFADMNTDTKKVYLDDPTVIKVHDFLYEMLGDPLITVPYNEFIGNKMSFDQFNQGNVGMWPEQLWTVSNLRMLQKTGEAKFDWGIVTWPHFSWQSESQGIPPGVQPTSITTNSKNKDAAWIFLKWYFGDQFQTERSKIGVIPSVTSSGAVAAFKNGEKGLDNYDTVIKQKFAKLHINIDSKTASYELQYKAEVQKIMDKFMLRQIDTKECIKEKKELIQKIFDSIK